jgi:hypothetical protein
MVDGRTGKLLAVTPVLGSDLDNLTLHSTGGRLYSPGFSHPVGNGNTVVVLSTQSGRVLRALTLPGAPPK